MEVLSKRQMLSSSPSTSEEHQPSVEASPGGGDALVCCCSPVFRSEGSQLVGTGHPVLWYVCTALPIIPQSVCSVCVVSVYMCFRRAEKGPVSGRPAGSSGGRKLLTGRPADAQRLQDVER